MKFDEVPKDALQFSNPEIQFELQDEIPKLKMVGYSGKVIPNHFYWGNLVIDLQGMQFEKDKYPILEQHDIDKKIAFTNKPEIVDNQLVINPDSVIFLDTDEAKKFIANSKKGFPYEASIYAVPLEVQSLSKDESEDVNGFTFTGPGKIWKQSRFKEVSACVFGYDTNTSAQAMTEIIDIVQEDTKEMDINELKEKHPNLFELIVKETKDSFKPVEQKFAESVDQLNKTITELEAKLQEQEKQIMQFEKESTLRKEQELAMKADTIWTEALSKSNVPEHLFSKVKKHVVYKDHLKDGELDETAFAKAIQDEIKDWEDGGVTSNVIGGAFGKPKDIDQKKNELADTEDRTNSLLKLAGIQI